jgi:NADH-quinone oxidoreductase subunit J
MALDTILQNLAFFICSILGIAGGIGLVWHRNPIMAALCLIVNFFCIAGLYLSLHAEFIAVIQIIVYAGAIMVLFLFVIMLLNLQDELKMQFDITKGIALIVGLAFLAEIAVACAPMMTKSVAGDNFAFGKVEPIGRELMTNYLFPFEMISVVLLAALIGAIVVAKKHSYDKQ